MYKKEFGLCFVVILVVSVLSCRPPLRNNIVEPVYEENVGAIRVHRNKSSLDGSPLTLSWAKVAQAKKYNIYVAVYPSIKHREQGYYKNRDVDLRDIDFTLLGTVNAQPMLHADLGDDEPIEPDEPQMEMQSCRIRRTDINQGTWAKAPLQSYAFTVTWLDADDCESEFPQDVADGYFLPSTLEEALADIDFNMFYSMSQISNFGEANSRATINDRLDASGQYGTYEYAAGDIGG